MEAASERTLPSTMRVGDATSPPQDSARTSAEHLDGFHSLVRDIDQVLGPCNGIDSAGVDVEELKKLMADYTSCEDEWRKYAFSDDSRAYTRNLVDRVNGKCNLLLLVWTPGKGSPIHDHANAHCVMKILKGSLTEVVYGWPCQRSSKSIECSSPSISPCPKTEHSCSARDSVLEPAALHVQRETKYDVDSVTYMSDRLGLHRIRNSSLENVAVSLHLYTPPNAAKHGCHIFDESTGKKSHVQQCHFYSELGVKI